MTRGYDPDRLRAGLRSVLLEGVFRVVHRSHRAAPLAATPAPSRFSDPQMRYAVWGQAPAKTRDRYTSTFQKPVASIPHPQVLFNCNVLTAGFDAPETSAAVIGQPTKSAVRLQQMVGRALRGPKSGGTEEAAIHMIVDESYGEFADLAEMFCQWEGLWEEGGLT